MSDISQGQMDFSGTGDYEPQGDDYVDQRQSDNSGQGSQDEYSLAGDFLGNVPEEHRSILEPYVKRWDAGVTRRFQELHSQYRPYEELGADPETLRQAYSLMEQINTNPQSVYQALAEALEYDDPSEQGFDGYNGQGYGEQSPGLPPEFQQTQEAVAAIAEFILDQQRTQQEQAEDAELDNYLSNLKQEFGVDFDEDYVLAKMYKGMDGAAAVKSWMNAMQQMINQQAPVYNTPPVLGGGGQVPMEAQRVTDLDRKDVKNLVAAIMQNQSQG